MFLTLKLKYRRVVADTRKSLLETIIQGLTVITEPGNNFLTHITSECSNGKGIAESVIDYYYTKNLHLDKLLDICCSGPAPGIGDIGSRLGRQILGGANYREKKYFSDKIHYTIG